MKLIKIGSAPSNDIVLNSQYVSGKHAVLIVLDDGSCIIEDRGSTNGTFLDNNHQNRLQPGVQQTVHRGDVVIFGDTRLPWNRVPQPDNNSQYARVINIGSDSHNNLVESDPSVSRFHAVVKIDKNKRAFIIDNKSTNGTEVKGVKIAPNTPVRIYRGTPVVVGHTDITAKLAPMLHKRFDWLKAAGIAAAVAVVAVLVAVVVSHIFPSHKDYKQSVVMVFHEFDYTVELTNNAFNTPLKVKIDLGVALTGTAFFIDDNGHMGTNRHVVEPWREEYDTDTMHTKLKQFLSAPGNLPKDFVDYLNFDGSGWTSGHPILNDVVKQILQFVSANATNDRVKIAEFNSVLQSIQSGAYTISGESTGIYILYPGRHYASLNESDRAVTLAVWPDEKADVAILRLNSNVTPEKCKPYLSIEDCYMGALKAGQGPLKSIGYPTGLVRAFDDSKKTIEPTEYESKVSKGSSRYTFEIQQTAAGGASGSPVFFDNNGELAGVLSSHWIEGTTTVVVQAKYLKELYDKEIR